MYLTRTKLLAAGLMLVGVLTTGVGVLSTADAQAPPNKNYADELKKYYDALRSHEAPRDRWEYKFIPVDKPLLTDDLQKVLAGADREGWSYCGSQELAVEKTGKILPHMVFKRPRAGGVADEDRARREAAAVLEAVRAADQSRAAALEQLKLEELELAKRQAEAERARKRADEKAASEKAARDAADRARNDAAKQRAEAEEALRTGEGKAAADRAARDAGQVRQQELEALRAKYEAVIQQLQAELKARSAAPAKKPEPQASTGDPFRSAAGQPRPDEMIAAIVKLHHLDGKTAAQALSKVFPNAKIVAETRPDSITLTGPAKVVMEAREVLQTKLDVAEGTKADPDAKVEVAAIKLRYAKAADVGKVLEKVGSSTKAVRIAYDTASNAIFITAPPAALADLKKLVSEMDKSDGPAK